MLEVQGGPLQGIRVIDISSSYAAPVATMYLADMGAEVIKVEPPERGDDSRAWGPPFIEGHAAWYLAANRNKRSACIDLSTEQGRDVLMRLLEDADVFVENLNPAKLAGLGLDPATLTARFPRLVYCAVSGFGLTGPASSAPGYDLIAQARSGLMSVTGPAGGVPQRVSTALSDIAAGTLAAFAIASALVRQQLTGRGDVVDVALLEADIAFMAPRIASFLAGDPEPRPSGGADSVLAVYQAFDTADRAIVAAVGNDRMWQRFCEALGLPELAGNEAYATNERRREHRRELVPVIERRLLERSAAEWLAVLATAGVPCAPIQFLSEVVEDEQVQARGVIAETEHPEAGTVRTVGAPWRLWSTVGREDRPAPLLGADTRSVLGETGFEPGEIDELESGGVVWSGLTRTS
jgi:crotonobetainyl-CoA:carnitine CoA-transferase CaiB-like acyl-CoA transferase